MRASSDQMDLGSGFRIVNLDGTGKLRKMGWLGIVVLHGRVAKKLLPGGIHPTDSQQSIFDSQPIRTKYIGADR